MTRRPASIVLHGGKTGGNGERAAQRVVDVLPASATLLHAADPEASRGLDGTDLLVLLLPTTGDNEVTPAVEALFFDAAPNLTGCSFALCEVGNYVGVEEIDAGPAALLARRLADLGAMPLLPHCSLDSVPSLDEAVLQVWTDALCRAVTKKWPRS